MRITLLDLAYNDLSCLNISSSSFLFLRNTNPRYLKVFTYVNGSVPIETVGQYNLKRQGLNAMHTDFTGLNNKSFAMLYSIHTSSNFYRPIAVGAMTQMSSTHTMWFIHCPLL